MKTIHRTPNAWILAALALAMLGTARAQITIVSQANGYLGSDKTKIATAHNGTTLLSYDATGVTKLVVAIGFESGFNNNSATVVGVTFNGVALTQAVQENSFTNTSYDGGAVAIYYLDNPFQGAATFTVSLTTSGGGPNGGLASIIGLSGTGGGIGNTGKNWYTQATAGNVSTSITTTAFGSMVIAAVENSGRNNGAGTPTAVAPLTLGNNGNWSNYGSVASGYQLVPGVGTTITPTFNTAAGGNIHVVAVEFTPPVSNQYWDVNNTSAGAGGPAATGTWDAAGTKWNTVAAGTGPTAAWSAGSTAIFAAGTDATGTYSVTMNGTQDITGLTFDEGTVTLANGSAGSLRLTGNSPANIASGLTATLAIPVGEDTAGRQLVKVGPGTLVLSGDSTHTGVTSVNAGTLVLSGNNVAATGGMALSGGVTQFELPASMNGTARDVTVNAGGTVVFGASFGAGNIPSGLARIVTTSAGVIAADHYDATNLDFNTPGLTAAYLGAVGSVSYTGTLTPNGTTYHLGGGGGTLTMANTNAITGAGNSLVVRGNVNLTGSNNHGGGTTLTTGTLAVGNDSSLGSGTLTINGGVLQSTDSTAHVLANALALGGDVTVGGTGNLTLSNTAATALGATRTFTINNGSSTFAQAFSGTAFGITKAGTGALTLSGNNSYTGLTTVTAGTLTLSGNHTGTGGVTLTAGTLNVNHDHALGNSGTLTISAGMIDNTKGSAVVNSVATPVTLGGNFTFSTPAGISNNNLHLGTGAVTNAGSRTITLNGTGTTLTLGGVMTNSATAVQTTTVNGPGNTLVLGGYALSNSATSYINVITGTGNVTITGAVTNGGTATASGLTKQGSGTLTLTAANTYSGATTISDSTLRIGDGGTTGSLTTSGITNNATLVYHRSNDLSVGHVISGSGDLTKLGAGTLTLTVAPTYSGDTNVSAGTLKLNGPNPNNDTAVVTIASAATLNLNFSGTDTVSKLYIDATPLAAGVYKAVGNAAPGIAIAQITGTGTLTVSGDLTPPTLTGIVDSLSGRRVVANSLVTYTVTFSEDMDAATVSAADFGNAGTATISIGTITETAPGVFTVPVTPTNTGSLRLQIPAGATLTDVAGNPLATTTAIPDDSTLAIYLPDSTSPALRGISPVSNNSGATLSIAMPSGVVAGDLLIANIAQYTSSSGNPTASGWTLISGKSLGGSTSRYGAVLYKVAAPSETGPYAFTLTGTTPAAAGVIMAFSSVDTSGGSFDATLGSLYTGTAAATAVGPAAQLTTISPNARVLMLGMAVSTASATWSNWSTTSSGTLAELYDLQGGGTGNNATSLGAAWAVKTTPGLTGTGGATLSASARNGSILLALKPSYNAALLTALTELKDHINGTITLSAAQIDAHKLTIDARKSLFGSSVSAIVAAMDLVETYDSVIGPLWVAQSGFTRATVTNDIHWTIFNVMQDLMDLTYTAANIANLVDLLSGFQFGSSANFPGACTPPADPDLTHTAIINGNYLDTWGWPVMHEERPARKPTGTYLAPGSIATVAVPAALVGKGYQIRVGCHAWDFTDKPTVKRLDRVTLVYPITAIETKVANPLGGGIYVEVPQYVTDVGVVNVQIKNAVRSPYFSAKSFHQTTPTQWLTERANPAPWADFQSEKYMMQVPTSWISAMPDPTQLMKDWDSAADTCNDLMGFPHDRGKETMYDQVDLLLRGSAYFPGYPTGNNSYSPTTNYGGYANSYLVRGPRYAPDFQFHEHGHGFLFPKFPGETEAEVNLLHVAVWHQKFGYSLEEAFRKSRSGYPTYATLDTTAIAWMMCDNFLNGIAMEAVEKQYQLKGHSKFVDIARMFGWQKLNQYWFSCTSDYENNVSYGTDVDSLLLRLSKSVGVDIRPLFHFWGVPPVNNTTLGTAIAAANLHASTAIYDTLVHYQALIPADNATFQTFASNWWGRQPLLTGYTEENNHARRWDTYNATAAASTANRAQQIINLYFPGGRPDDVPPALTNTAIVDNKNGGPVTLSTVVTFTVTFSEDMDATTVSAADFGNAGSAAITIGTVTEISPGIFSVPVTPTAAGTLQLQVIAGAVLKDVAGNALDTASAIADDTTMTVTADYANWTGGPFLGTLTDTRPALDFDGGGLATGIEWVTGGDPTKGGDDAGLAPTLDTTTDPNGKLLFTYRRSDAANADANTAISVQYGSDLTGWTTATHQGAAANQITISGTPDAPGFARITVALPPSITGTGRFFARLKVVLTQP